MFPGNRQAALSYGKNNIPDQFPVRKGKTEQRSFIRLQHSVADGTRSMRRSVVNRGQFLFFMRNAHMMKQRVPDAAECKQQNRSQQKTIGWCQTFSFHGIIK